MRRRTEVLVHGSTVDGEKEEEKFKQLTLRRMQTRGKLVGALMGKVNKEKLAEFNPSKFTRKFNLTVSEVLRKTLH